MFESFWDSFVWFVGGREEYDQLSVVQVMGRTAVVFIIALVIIRLSKRRFMGDYSSFDVLLGFVVGSVMASGITGRISLINMTMVVGVLVGMHWLAATLSYYSKPFRSLIENSRRELIKDGEIDRDALQESKIPKTDLMMAVRNARLEDIDEVKSAYLEADGTITVIPRDEA